jgi:hypothetical protein
VEAIISIAISAAKVWVVDSGLVWGCGMVLGLGVVEEGEAGGEVECVSTQERMTSHFLL